MPRWPRAASSIDETGPTAETRVPSIRSHSTRSSRSCGSSTPVLLVPPAARRGALASATSPRARSAVAIRQHGRRMVTHFAGRPEEAIASSCNRATYIAAENATNRTTSLIVAYDCSADSRKPRALRWPAGFWGAGRRRGAAEPSRPVGRPCTGGTPGRLRSRVGRRRR